MAPSLFLGSQCSSFRSCVALFYAIVSGCCGMCHRQSRSTSDGTTTTTSCGTTQRVLAPGLWFILVWVPCAQLVRHGSQLCHRREYLVQQQHDRVHVCVVRIGDGKDPKVLESSWRIPRGQWCNHVSIRMQQEGLLLCL